MRRGGGATHSLACSCREQYFDKMKQALEIAQTAMSHILSLGCCEEGNKKMLRSAVVKAGKALK